MSADHTISGEKIFAKKLREDIAIEEMHAKSFILRMVGNLFGLLLIVFPLIHFVGDVIRANAVNALHYLVQNDKEKSKQAYDKAFRWSIIFLLFFPYLFFFLLKKDEVVTDDDVKNTEWRVAGADGQAGTEKSSPKFRIDRNIFNKMHRQIVLCGVISTAIMVPMYIIPFLWVFPHYVGSRLRIAKSYLLYGNTQKARKIITDATYFLIFSIIIMPLLLLAYLLPFVY